MTFAAFQRDPPAHAPDNAVADAQAQTRPAVIAGGALGRLFEFAEDSLLRLRGDADAGVAHDERDLSRPDARLGNQRNAAGLRKFDGVACKVEQHLAQPRGVAKHLLRQTLIDIGGDLELARLRAWREQFGDVLDHGGERERTLLKVDLAGFDLGEIEQFVDQRHQRVAGCLDRLGIGSLLGGERCIEQEVAHADDAVQGRADFMRRHGKEFRFGAVRRIGVIARLGQRALGARAVGDVAAHTLHVGGLVRVAADQSFAPGDPARSKRAVDLLVVNAGAIRLKGNSALFQHGQYEARPDQGLARLARKRAVRIVDRGDDAVTVAQHDQIALGFEQAAGMFLCAFQFPVAIGESLVVHLDLAHLFAQPAHPHAECRKRKACNGKQETCAERKGVRIVGFAPASGDKSIRAAEGGGKDRHRAKGDVYPGMASGKPAEARPDTQGSQHKGPLRGWITGRKGFEAGCGGDVSKCLKRAGIAAGDSNMANGTLTPHIDRSAMCTRRPAPTKSAAASFVLNARDCTKTR